MAIKILRADYTNPRHQQDLVFLLNEYSLDPMGAGKPLAEFTRKNLAESLSKLPHAFSVIAYVDEQPAALTNCFEAFSTFACKPLINIHDVCVLPQFRGLQLSQKLLEKVEEIAKEKDCCKITLEVLSNNTVAKSAYKKFGFNEYQLDPENGSAQFWQKDLK